MRRPTNTCAEANEYLRGGQRVLVRRPTNTCAAAKEYLRGGRRALVRLSRENWIEQIFHFTCFQSSPLRTLAMVGGDTLSFLARCEVFSLEERMNLTISSVNFDIGLLSPRLDLPLATMSLLLSAHVPANRC